MHETQGLVGTTTHLGILNTKKDLSLLGRFRHDHTLFENVGTAAEICCTYRPSSSTPTTSSASGRCQPPWPLVFTCTFFKAARQVT